MTLAVFHELPGLENGLTKFYDFPGRVVTLHSTHSVEQMANCGAPSLNKWTDWSGNGEFQCMIFARRRQCLHRYMVKGGPCPAVSDSLKQSAWLMLSMSDKL